MTEVSYPFAGTTIGDAGPYSAEDWYDAWGAITHGGVENIDSRYYGIGVVHGVRSDLYPSENGTDIDVAAGASLIDGLYHENFATVNIPIDAATSNPRIDYIVVRKNFQQATDYDDPLGSAPSVEARTARITVIRGTEAAVPTTPSLTRDRSTYWDIPIATVQVSTGGVLSNFTDQRQFLGSVVGTDIIADDNASLNTALQLISTVNDGSGAADFGASLDYLLENDSGNLKNTLRLCGLYDDATDGAEDSKFELRLISNGSENLSGVISAPASSSVDGNDRGGGSVDLQSIRANADEVASATRSAIIAGENNKNSGVASSILGGSGNTISTFASSICGGEDCEVNNGYSGILAGRDNVVGDGTGGSYFSAILAGDDNLVTGNASYCVVSGYRGRADKYGQVVSGGGNSTISAGNVQGTIQMIPFEEEVSHTDATWHSLFLAGAGIGLDMVIRPNTAWTFHILLTGITANAAQQWSYEINGLIERDNADNTTLAASSVTTIFESDASYEAQVIADDTNEALVVQVRNNGGTNYTVRWVATVRTCEVTYS